MPGTYGYSGVRPKKWAHQVFGSAKFYRINCGTQRASWAATAQPATSQQCSLQPMLQPASNAASETVDSPTAPAAFYLSKTISIYKLIIMSVPQNDQRTSQQKSTDYQWRRAEICSPDLMQYLFYHSNSSEWTWTWRSKTRVRWTLARN
jgi:hypothetical protein